MLGVTEIADIDADRLHCFFEIIGTAQLDTGLESGRRDISGYRGHSLCIRFKVDLHDVHTVTNIAVIREQRNKGHIEPDIESGGMCV